MTFILLYSLIQLSLARAYRKRKHETIPKLEEFPRVLVQLPIYNEKYVVERLIDQVIKLDYPKDLLEIQVLDDSDDETLEIVRAKCLEYQARGFNIFQVRRPDRKGFKAGALSYGLTQSEAEFVAIFDSDFLPEPDFLKRSLGFFNDPKLAAVQTRWEHLNESYNILTRLQAFVLNAHFSVEQSGRSSKGRFINFNGTAGVWRVSAIEDAGGWQSDTLTEDLDLSYRAQLKDWKLKFIEEIGSPAELPIEMNALRTQQFRWNKGAAECTVKNLPAVLRKKNIDLGTKIHAAFHLMNSFLFICVLTIALLNLPLIWSLSTLEDLSIVYQFGSIFLTSLFFLAYFYWLAFKKDNPDKNLLYFFREFVLFLAFSLGLSLHNGWAVIEGYLGIKTPFLRTPKFDVGNQLKDVSQNVYRLNQIPMIAFAEIILLCYFAISLTYAIRVEAYGILPFTLLLLIGYMGVVWQTFFRGPRSSLQPTS